MDYMIVQFLPYVLLVFAVGVAVGWGSVEK